MSKHLFGLIVTPYGTAANNRGENEGNITTLQKILWKGEVCTTVSAEAIRWALRYYWQEEKGYQVNRQWDRDIDDHRWQDPSWLPWTSPDKSVRSQPTFIDDDVMGFMLAEAASTDGSDTVDALKKEKKEKEEALKKLSNDEQKSQKGKELKEEAKKLSEKIKQLSEGTCDKRRGALEVTRAISLSPFAGDITFNAKSGKKNNTSLYGTEVHATRYQYGLAITPQYLRETARVLDVIDATVALCEVAGNHSRFLYEFAPDSLVFRWTDDFAPRILYGFEMAENGKLSFPSIIEKVKAGDINPKELFIGGSIISSLTDEERKILEGAVIKSGIKAVASELKARIEQDLKTKEE